MDGFRRFFNRSGGKKYAPVPSDIEENFDKFTKELKSEEINNLQQDYTHTVTNRYITLQDVLHLVLHFRNVSENFKQFMSLPNFWYEWHTYAAKILNLLIETDKNNIAVDISSLEEMMTNSANTIMTVLELKYQLKSLFHDGLKRSNRTVEDDSYTSIATFFLNCLDFLDTLIDTEMNNLFNRYYFLQGNEMTENLFKRFVSTLLAYEVEIPSNLWLESEVIIDFLRFGLQDYVPNVLKKPRILFNDLT